jgi:predicted phage terminase large subunit-like protein
LSLSPSIPPEEELKALALAYEAKMLSDDLRLFTSQAWPIIEPHTEYLDNWHIGAQCEYLKAVMLGQIQRLIINIPPRMMKSILITIMFPVWLWTMKPWMRFMFTSFHQDLVKEHSVKRRDIIQSLWYQERFGGRCVSCEQKEIPCTHRVIIADDQNEKKEFKTTAGGLMLGFPIGGAATGRGANGIIIDDPIDPQKALSDAERKSANGFIESTLFSRLNNKRRDWMILVMQRVHQKDPTGVLLEKGGWELLKLPAFAPKGGQHISLPISGKVIKRKEGEVLWPEREGKKELEIMRAATTEVNFSGQYQQEPAPPTGAIFKREWWLRYDVMPAQFDFILDSWDCTFKDLATSDWVVGTKWGVRGRSIYLLALVRQKMGFEETQLAVKGMKHWRNLTANQIIIEDKANGTAIVEVLKKAEWNVEAVNPEGGKVSRAYAASPTIRGGCVFLPSDQLALQLNIDVNGFIEETARFTGKEGEEDDQVDSMTQAIIFIVLQAGGIYAWMQEKIEQRGAAEQQAAQDEVAKQAVINQTWSKTIDALKKGAQIQCNPDQYKNGMRAELQRFQAACQQLNDVENLSRVTCELARLDTIFGVK